MADGVVDSTERGGSIERAVISDLSRSLARIVWHFGPRGLHGECCEDLTMPEFIALDKVATTPGCPVQEVGYALGFTKSGATRVVDRLKSKGYVAKIRSEEDGRVCCVRVTETGLRALGSVEERYQEQFQALATKVPRYAASDLSSMITAMARAMKS